MSCFDGFSCGIACAALLMSWGSCGVRHMLCLCCSSRCRCRGWAACGCACRLRAGLKLGQEGRRREGGEVTVLEPFWKDPRDRSACACASAPCWPVATLKGDLQEDPTGVSRTWEGRGDLGQGTGLVLGSLPPFPHTLKGLVQLLGPLGQGQGAEEFRHMFSVHWTGSLGLGHRCRNDLTWLVFCP